MAASRRLPLAPIFIVLVILGPLHLSSIHHASLNTNQVPHFLDRRAFQERRGGQRRGETKLQHGGSATKQESIEDEASKEKDFGADESIDGESENHGSEMSWEPRARRTGETRVSSINNKALEKEINSQDASVEQQQLVKPVSILHPRDKTQVEVRNNGKGGGEQNPLASERHLVNIDISEAKKNYSQEVPAEQVQGMKPVSILIAPIVPQIDNPKWGTQGKEEYLLAENLKPAVNEEGLELLSEAIQHQHSTPKSNPTSLVLRSKPAENQALDNHLPGRRYYEHSDLGNLTQSQIKEYEALSPRASFDLAYQPMFSVPSPGRKIKLLYLTQKLGSGKVQHVFLDGFNRSDYIQILQVIVMSGNDPMMTPQERKEKIENMTYVDQGEDVWVDDSPNLECPQILHLVKQQKRPVPILQLDYKDFSMSLACPALEEIMGPQQLRYVKRSIVEDRKFNWTSLWIDHGHYFNNTGRNILHAPYTVRTDQVQVMQRFLNNTGLTSPVDWDQKKFDIAHFWGVGMDPVSKLRNRITEIVKEFDGLEVAPGKKLKCYARLAGSRGTEGRRNVQELYVKIMMKSRIVVVTQRDNWEGHYRLMEALAGGVMVVADFMLSLPRGLVDRESIVLFRSEAELRSVLTYYSVHDEERLAIAQRGWEVAMGRHRSWHRMEEILFGQPLTDVDNPHGPYAKRGSTPI